MGEENANALSAVAYVQYSKCMRELAFWMQTAYAFREAATPSPAPPPTTGVATAALGNV
jgi:hypothetical protein